MVFQTQPKASLNSIHLASALYIALYHSLNLASHEQDPELFRPETIQISFPEECF